MNSADFILVLVIHRHHACSPQKDTNESAIKTWYSRGLPKPMCTIKRVASRKGLWLGLTPNVTYQSVDCSSVGHGRSSLKRNSLERNPCHACPTSPRGPGPSLAARNGSFDHCTPKIKPSSLDLQGSRQNGHLRFLIWGCRVLGLPHVCSFKGN